MTYLILILQERFQQVVLAKQAELFCQKYYQAEHHLQDVPQAIIIFFNIRCIDNK